MFSVGTGKVASTYHRHYLWNPIQHLVTNQYLLAELDELSDGLAVSGRFQERLRDQDDRLREVQLEPALFAPAP